VQFEERVRNGLRSAGIEQQGWQEILAVNLIPEPSQWGDGRKLWKFFVPDNLFVTIITGEKVRRRRTFGGPHYPFEFNFYQPGVLLVIPRTPHPKVRGPLKIPTAKVKAIELTFCSPESFKQSYDALYGPNNT